MQGLCQRNYLFHLDYWSTQFIFMFQFLRISEDLAAVSDTSYRDYSVDSGTACLTLNLLPF